MKHPLKTLCSSDIKIATRGLGPSTAHTLVWSKGVITHTACALNPHDSCLFAETEERICAAYHSRTAHTSATHAKLVDTWHTSDTDAPAEKLYTLRRNNSPRTWHLELQEHLLSSRQPNITQGPPDYCCIVAQVDSASCAPQYLPKLMSKILSCP